jgi:bifunctional non-homologous end joining protein LigD
LLDTVSPPIIYGDHVIGRGEALFEQVCKQGGEGIVSKKASAPYKGTRTRCWLKVKCIQRQEFVIVGWSESDKRLGFRSLLLAAKEHGKLTYVGKVGTGFSGKLINEMMDRMKPLEVDKAPVEVPRADRKAAHFIKPQLVAEIAFTEFTGDGILRHPSFIGLREDKPASQVVVETPKHLTNAEQKAGRPTPESFGIKITNPERAIFPDEGLTKADLANYYAAVDPLIMVDAARRPMTLIRCPQGRSKKCFFQKHDSGTFGEHVKHVPVREKKGDTQDYLYFDDIRGLLACVQMGTIEFHGWGSKVDPLEYPDRLVFDLDPDVGLDFGKVKEAAVKLKALLADLGLETFPLLSGGKGLHVVAPLDQSADWPAVSDFAERFSRAIAEAEPEMFTANIRKVQRKGRIFLDWLRNQRGATAVMPYSARAREGAPVAAPIAWEELDKYQGGNHFTIRDADELLERASSKMLAGWGQTKQALPNA